MWWKLCESKSDDADHADDADGDDMATMSPGGLSRGKTASEKTGGGGRGVVN